MDVHVIGGRSSLQDSLLSRRLEAQRDVRFPFRGLNEGFITTDVIARAFVGSPACRVQRKELDGRQENPLEVHSRGTRPEFTSLADIYEGALRKVLNIQLNLKIDEQPHFNDGSDVTYRDKMSPPRPKALRLEDLKHRDEFRHHRRAQDDENDPRVTPQGHTTLRKLGERTSEASAFHVPLKRRFDGVGFQPMERESRFPVDRFGVVPSHHYPSHVPSGYGARMDPGRNARLGPSYEPPRGITQETYSRYSSHQREIPPLFPVRCSTMEVNGPFTQRRAEQEVKRSSPDVPRRSTEVSRLNRLCEKLPFSRLEARTVVKVEREEREDGVFDKINFEEKFNKANEHITSSIRRRALVGWPERKSPFSLRFRPYTLRYKNNSGLINGDVDSKCKGLEKQEMKREEKRFTGEEGKKEEFLSNLGLARIYQ